MTKIIKAPETMSSRERVIRTFQFEKTDRVTIGYDANAGINQRLMQELGASTGEEVMEALGVDYRGIGAPYIGPKLFADRLNFRGCISTTGPLAYGTKEEVWENCRETLEIMMPYRGYHFAPTHCIQDNSPVENVVAMY